MGCCGGAAGAAETGEERPNGDAECTGAEAAVDSIGGE